MAAETLWYAFRHRLLRFKGALREQSLRQRARAASLKDYPLRGMDQEAQAREALKIIDDYTMCSYERMVSLWQQVRYLDRASIAGSLVECGVWKGGAVGMMAKAHQSCGTMSRPLHLFDSFEGSPEPDEAKDGSMAKVYSRGMAKGNLHPIDRCAAPLDGVRHLLEAVLAYPKDLIHYHVGWFQDTVAVAARNLGPIALLRLDGNWYESTKVCLDALGPLVPRGGIIIIDDYGKWPGCRQAVEEYLTRMRTNVLINHIDSAGRYWIVP